MPSTITALTMPAGLKAILDINLDFITNNKNPLITSTQDLKDDDGNQLEPVYTSGPIKELIEGHLDSKFHSTPIINFDVTFFTWNFSPGGASQDSLYNTFGWERKQKLIEFLVDVQLLNGVEVSLPNDYKYDIDNTTQKTLYEEHLSGKLSYEAVILRSNVLSWIYERMMNDYQAEIDAWNGWFDQYPAGLDFGVSLINSIKNLATPSSSNRSLIKIGGKTSMMTTSSGENEEDQSLDDYKFYKYHPFNLPVGVESIKLLFNTTRDLILDEDELEKLAKNNITASVNSLSEKITTNLETNALYRNLLYTFKINDHQLTNSEIKQFISVKNSSTTANLVTISFEIALPSGFERHWLLDSRTISDETSYDASVTELEKLRAVGSSVVKTLEPYFRANRGWFDYLVSEKGITKIFYENIPDFLETSKLFLEWRRSQIFYGLDTVKGDFERLADVTNTVPGIMQRTMSYLNSGHYFDAATNVRSIGPKLITLSGTPASDSVTLNWNTFSGATKYYVFKNGTPYNVGDVQNITIGEGGEDDALTPETSYSFYVNAVNDLGTVLAQSQTIMVTTEPAPEQE